MTRDVSQGSVVSPVPLIQIMDKTSLQIKSTKVAQASQQLLTNYCFGHRKSSLRLCPTTNVMLVNHNSVHPNAKLRWSPSNSNVVDRDVKYLVESLDKLQCSSDDFTTLHTRLAMELVATRDIQQGEEIFIDYGAEWEAAYQAQWDRDGTRDTTDDGLIPAAEMNREIRPIVPSGKLSTSKYWYECQLYPDVQEYQPVPVEEFELSDQNDPQSWSEEEHAWYGDNDFISWYPCKVIRVGADSPQSYSVAVYAKPLAERRHIRSYVQFPRHRIRFVDKPYESDQHLPWSFRHFIGIPDSMFPLRWRDDYSSASFWNLGSFAASEDSAPADYDHEEKLRSVKCGSYMAKSSIPKAGMYLHEATFIDPFLTRCILMIYFCVNVPF